MRLSERVEAATGPDRELDAEIFKGIGAPVPFQFANKLIALEFNDVEQAYFARVTDDIRVRYSPPHYTAGLDAAMTLLTDDLPRLLCLMDMGDGTWTAKLWKRPACGAATPVLALTAAALKARGL